MARPKSTVPSYCHHKPSGTARCWVAGRWVSLGKYDSPESRAAYARVLAELAVAPAPTAAGHSAHAPGRPGLSVSEMLLAFWRYAEGHYRRADGTPTNELPQYKQTFRLVRGLYGPAPAAEFGPLALKAVRQAMVDKGWTRKLVNQRIGRVRRAFKWAASEQLVPAAVCQALATVQGLQAGRTSAGETAPVRPVADAAVEATVPHLPAVVAAMVAVQRLAGLRPGEVCRLRPCEVDMSGAVWVYRPGQHKTAWRGKARAVAIGPRAQAILAQFAPADPDGYYFCPKHAVAAFRAARAAARKTPPYPSHLKRNAAVRVAAPKRAPAAKYTVTSYGRAVARAVVKANARRARLAGQGNFDPVPHWHPNQLRHAHGTAVRARYGLEAAQVALGHERADVTQVYAARDLALALQVAAEIG